MKAVLLFPGQGTQKVGMGKDLAERFPAARAVFQRADAALGTPLSRLMWDGPESDLTLTHNAQPAILVHALAVHAVVGERLSPVAAAGHSLGEYAAYAALGALAPDDAVRLVRRRGELMFQAGTARPGTMAAVLGLAGEAVAEICARESRNGHVVVAANLNAPDQTVISGDPEAVERAGEALKSAGAKRVIGLKVSGAFHSPLMAPAAEGLARELARVSIGHPAAPVIANASAAPVRDGAAARRLLGDQLTAPVRWVESMRAAVGLAAGATFAELGPGGVLAGLLKRISPGASAISLGT
ncbi:MAG TPA: ACP S-malonyltransferase, partial [Gemmatimonadales bacterium]|nr:ACP S-malonyltransferase [Gemmatimonadales bacterium]